MEEKELKNIFLKPYKIKKMQQNNNISNIPIRVIYQSFRTQLSERIALLPLEQYLSQLKLVYVVIGLFNFSHLLLKMFNFLESL